MGGRVVLLAVRCRAGELRRGRADRHRRSSRSDTVTS